MNRAEASASSRRCPRGCLTPRGWRLSRGRFRCESTRCSTRVAAAKFSLLRGGFNCTVYLPTALPAHKRCLSPLAQDAVGVTAARDERRPYTLVEHHNAVVATFFAPPGAAKPLTSARLLFELPRKVAGKERKELSKLSHQPVLQRCGTLLEARASAALMYCWLSSLGHRRLRTRRRVGPSQGRDSLSLAVARQAWPTSVYRTPSHGEFSES